jgi:hypothetical protein
MGRRRLAGSAKVGLYGSAEVLLSEGRGEDGLVVGSGGCPRMGVETCEESSSSGRGRYCGWDMINVERVKLRE